MAKKGGGKARGGKKRSKGKQGSGKGKKAKGQIPLEILEKRFKRLGGIVESRGSDLYVGKD